MIKLKYDEPQSNHKFLVKIFSIKNNYKHKDYKIWRIERIKNVD